MEGTRFEELTDLVRRRTLSLVRSNRSNPEQPGTTFDFCGTAIADPVLDETGRVQVDPVAYYGSAFLESQFCEEDRAEDVSA